MSQIWTNGRKLRSGRRHTMQKLYKWSDVDAQFDKHPVTAQIEAVEAAFEATGRTVDLKAMVTPDAGSEPASAGLLITPDLSDGLEETLDNIGWLSVNREIAETFGEASASAELTNVVVRNDLTVEEVVEMLSTAEYSEEDDTDMLTKVIHLVQLVGTENDPEPVQVAAYDVLRKSLGWEAERLLNRTDDFHKALASLDDLGVDLGTNAASPWNCGDAQGFQLKTMQRVTSQSLHRKDHEIPHLSYAWTTEGILVADMDERSGSDGQAKRVADDAGTTQTVVKKSLQSGPLKNYPRPARVIAWE